MLITRVIMGGALEEGGSGINGERDTRLWVVNTQYNIQMIQYKIVYLTYIILSTNVIVMNLISFLKNFWF